MLLNILQCPGQPPPQRRLQPQNVNCARMERPSPRRWRPSLDGDLLPSCMDFLDHSLSDPAPLPRGGLTASGPPSADPWSTAWGSCPGVPRRVGVAHGSQEESVPRDQRSLPPHCGLCLPSPTQHAPHLGRTLPPLLHPGPCSEPLPPGSIGKDPEEAKK